MKKKVSKKSEEKLLDELLAKFVKPVPPKSKPWFKRDHYNWQHDDVIDTKYDTVRHCNENDNDCLSEGICRCSTIENLELIDYSHNNFVDVLTFGIGNEILIYCIDKIVRLAKINEDSFDADVKHYYYGEEIMGIYLNESIEKYLHENISKLKLISNIDRIKFVLNLEYLYLLDILKDTSEAKVQEIHMDKINFNKDYIKRIDISDDNYGEEFTLPRGIFLKTNDHYKLIDGYHRIAKAKSMEKNKVKAIVIE
jgi:hypothetical protein